MPHSFGYRARTRHMFKRGFQGTEHGPVKLSTFLINYHVGDIVDIKANAAQQKGMPHKYYHGCVPYGQASCTTSPPPLSACVIVYKVVGNRYIEKRVNLRVEHVRHSKCRQEFLDRVKRNHHAHVEAKEKGVRVDLKRIPALPREARTVASATGANARRTIVPVPYETTILG
ncbi:ribosomal protein L21e-domain-containing protein, partial [Mycena rebaudengoi]